MLSIPTNNEVKYVIFIPMIKSIMKKNESLKSFSNIYFPFRVEIFFFTVFIYTKVNFKRNHKYIKV